jgi:hypothetical protein
MPGPSHRNVVVRPKGDILVKGSVTTTASYADVGDCARKVTKDKIFQLAKITVSCPEDVMVKVVFGTTDISVEYYVMAKLPFTDWFPEGWNRDKLRGDGTKQIKIQAKYPSGGAAATVFAELAGEEV